MKKLRRAGIAGLLATGLFVGGAGTASALTWDDVMNMVFGDSHVSSSSTHDTPAKDGKDTGDKKDGSTEPAGKGEISQLLATLPDAVKGQSADSVVMQGEEDPSYTPYKREEYDRGGWKTLKVTGFDWGDIPKNCTTRQAALIRDGKNVKYDKNCKITSGEWTDLYGTGEKFDASTVRKMDIDHIVALGAVHASGGYKLSEDEKHAVASDPLNLVSVAASPNRQKSDQNADTWLPTGDFRCEYVSRQVQVKAKYKLSVTGAERATLQKELNKCNL